jgi:UDPglucose 6-dehydrogenase
MVPTGSRPDLFPGVAITGSALEALDSADAVVLVTEWPEFADLDWRVARERMRGHHVIDGRNFFDPHTVAAAGFSYDGIGTVNGYVEAAPAADASPVVADETS